MIKANLFLLITFMSLLTVLHGNSSLVDSLVVDANNYIGRDSTKVKLLIKVANEIFYSDIPRSMEYADKAYNLSDSLNYNHGKVRSLYLLGNFYRKSGDFKTAIDKYSELISLYPVGSNRKLLKNALKNIGYSYCMIGDVSSGLASFNRLLEINRKENSKKDIADTYNNIGNVYQMTGEIDSAFYNYNSSLEIWKEIGDKKEIADMNNNLGYMFMVLDRHYEALDHYLDALIIYEELGIEERIAMALNGIGTVYQGIGDLKLATDYFLRSLDYYKQLDEDESIAYCLSNLANMSNEERNYKQALLYYSQAAEILERLGHKNELGSVLLNQSVLYRDQGNYEKAMENCEKALILFKEISNKEGEGSVYLKMALIYFDKNELQIAKTYAEKALILVKEFDLLRKQEATHELLYEICIANKDYKNALNHYVNYKLIYDSLYNEENVKKITGLEYKYKFEKEKQAIEAEQQRKDALRIQELQRQKLMRNTFITGFILVLLLAIVILRSFLQKKAANRKLIEQNNIILRQKEEKELLVREIHHRVKNNLQIITSLFDLQMNTTENTETREALIDSLNRVKSVGLIHQLLYQTDDLISVDFKEFTIKLVDHISSFATRNKLSKSIEVSAGVCFSIETTISLGLIINELLTNSLKYAFVDQENCVIEVSLKRINDNDYRLVVADNGSGLPVDFNPAKSSSLGLRLVYTLAEQLSGTIKYRNDGGAKFTFEFSNE